VLVIGGVTAFFMALIAVVQYDIKRVVALFEPLAARIHDRGARRLGVFRQRSSTS